MYVELGENSIIVFSFGEDNVCVDFVIWYILFIEVRYKEVVLEVIIYFKFVGINYFISEVYWFFK